MFGAHGAGTDRLPLGGRPVSYGPFGLSIASVTLVAPDVVHFRINDVGDVKPGPDSQRNVAGAPEIDVTCAPCDGDVAGVAVVVGVVGGAVGGAVGRVVGFDDGWVVGLAPALPFAVLDDPASTDVDVDTEVGAVDALSVTFDELEQAARARPNTTPPNASRKLCIGAVCPTG